MISCLDPPILFSSMTLSASTESRPSSQIRRIVRDGEAIFEKRYIANDWDDNEQIIKQRVRCESEVLRRLDQSRLMQGRLGLVRVAASDPDTASIATHEVPGVSLDEFILRGRDKHRNLLPWLMAGRWLRRFQQLPIDQQLVAPRSDRDPEDIVAYCDLRLRSLADYGYRWPSDSTRQAILDFVANCRRECSESELRPVWVHADFAPGNLMWDGRTLTPLDFAMVTSGNRLADVTYLIHRVEMQKVYRPWLNLPTGAIRTAVLRGFGDGAATHSPLYRMMMIKHLICRLHTYVRRPARGLKQSAHDRWVRTVVRQRIRAAARNTELR